VVLCDRIPGAHREGGQNAAKKLPACRFLNVPHGPSRFFAGVFRLIIFPSVRLENREQRVKRWQISPCSRRTQLKQENSVPAGILVQLTYLAFDEKCSYPTRCEKLLLP
jgi:hypothetical protein